MAENNSITQIDWFHDLPLEIREIIWQYAAAGLPPQIVVVDPPIRTSISVWPRVVPIDPVVDYQPWGLLWACHDSRKAVLEHFPLRLWPPPHGAPQYVNPTTARLHIIVTEAHNEEWRFPRFDFRLFPNLTWWHRESLTPTLGIVRLNPQPFLGLRSLTVALPENISPNPHNFRSDDEFERRWIDRVQPQQRAAQMPVLPPPTISVYGADTLQRRFSQSRDGGIFALHRQERLQWVCDQYNNRLDPVGQWNERRRELGELATRRRLWESQMRHQGQVVQHTWHTQSEGQQNLSWQQRAILELEASPPQLPSEQERAWLQYLSEYEQQDAPPQDSTIEPAQEEFEEIEVVRQPDLLPRRGSDDDWEEIQPQPHDVDVEQEVTGPQQQVEQQEEESSQSVVDHAQNTIGIGPQPDLLPQQGSDDGWEEVSLQSQPDEIESQIPEVVVEPEDIAPEQQNVHHQDQEVVLEQEEALPQQPEIEPQQPVLEPQRPVDEPRQRLHLRLPTARTVGKVALFALAQYFFWSPLLSE